jgi:hypothetical protein
MKLMNATLVGLVGLVGTGAAAQETTKEILSEQVAKADLKVEGWDTYLALGLNGTLVQNQNVLGKDEGQTTTIGLKLDGELNHKGEQSVFMNSLSLMNAQSRTPLIGEYVKSDDKLKLESLYKHLFSRESSLGTFARAQLDTAVFPGYDTRAETNTYVISRLDATTETEQSDRLRLTDPFRPLKLSESVGAFANLYSSEIFSADVKAGLGFRQVYVKGQLALADDSNTPEIEVTELDDYRKAGYEIGTDLGGKTTDKRIAYKLSANVLFPFAESPDASQDDSMFDKRIIDVNGKVSVHLAEWVSLDYVLMALRDPNLTKETQLTQSVLLSSNIVLAGRTKE